MSNKPLSLLLFVSSVVLLSFAVGCAGPPKLGPKPDSYKYASEQWKNGLVDEFRAWLEKLDPANSQTLKKTGEVTLSYQELVKSDPEHAALLQKVADKLDSRQASISGLVFESVPDSVTFRLGRNMQNGGPAPGEYYVEVKFLQREKITWLLSYPLGASSP